MKFLAKFIMSLFDNFSNVRTTQTTDLRPAESFAGILLVTIAADGYLGKDEMQSFMLALYKMKLFQRNMLYLQEL